MPMENRNSLQSFLGSTEKCMSVIDAVADGILLFDQSGVFFGCNPSAERILGLTCNQMRGKKLNEMGWHFFRENGSRFPEKSLPPSVTLRTGKPCKDVIMGISRQEGNITWIKVNSEVLASETQPFAIMFSFSDISEHKRQQEALQQSYSALRELSFRLQHAREVERANIAREIHDELGSTLTSIKFDLSWSAEKSGNRAQLEDIFKGLDSAIQSVKRICTSLRPAILDDLGLLAALEWQLGQFGKKSGIRCKIETKGKEPVVPQDVATGIFRIFQETLTNIARHAEAANVKVEFKANERDIVLAVSDDGKGIDPKKTAASKSLGILGMIERAQALGGALSVQAAKPRGTRVTLSVPLERRTSARTSAASIP
jgi:PAS domain S-box-containing protein